MKYRPLGGTGLYCSEIAHGGSRFKDEKDSIEAIQESFNQGINLFETAPRYKNSEIFIGRALKGVRDKVIISTKCCIEDTNERVFTPEDIKLNIYQSLERLQTDYIDIYNIWRIKDKFFEYATKKDGFIDVVRSFMDQGIIRHFGFSSHDPVQKLIEYIDTGFFESMIVNKNILDVTSDPAIDYAHKKGIGVLIMRPLYGGFLCSDLDCLDFLGSRDNLNSKASSNIMYLLNDTNITSLLVGMTSRQEVVENCEAVRKSEPSRKDVESTVNEGMEISILNELKMCSGCGYCDFCPVKIPVSLLMKVYNFVNVKEINSMDRGIIKRIIREYGVNFDSYKDCISCGKCERLCTSGLDIMSRIKTLKSITQSL
jgi:predicted aldo/keto reductase-like oxidoreductase